MTQHTLEWALASCRQGPTSLLQVHYCGSDETQFADVFPLVRKTQQGQTPVELCSQADGDLGNRLKHAVSCAANAGFGKVAVVGTDCPRMHQTDLGEIFGRLDQHDACFVPAEDGGYVLIALNVLPGRPHDVDALLSAAFDGISWGSSEVLRESLDAFEAIGSSVSLTRPLVDVDSVEDVSAWEERDTPLEKPALSIVIPVFGHEPQLSDVLRSTGVRRSGAETAASIEVIVVGAGNPPGAMQAAAEGGAQYFCSTPGRGQQMNLGAKIASAPLLLFMHADSVLPGNYCDAVQGALSDPAIAAGAFRFQLESERKAARWVEWGTVWRCRLLGLPYGDQGLFLRHATFDELGGFKDVPIMEDLLAVQELKRYGRVVCSELPMTTSARRWEKNGFFTTTFVNQLMLAGRMLRIPPTRLAAFYRSFRR